MDSEKKRAEAEAFLQQIESLINRADCSNYKVSVDLDVTLNMRVNKQLREDFERLCKANHTNMSRELKRFMSLAVSAQKLI
ncbi:hypothetical protein [Campylobacter coli]|uniref:hypothetical protein n=1 Tax=Campylobacter coli TaxID=195 RepID=UPI00380E6D81